MGSCLKTVSEPYPRGINKFRCEDTFFSTNTLYILHPYKPPTEHISKRTSQQAGAALFLNSEMPKKFKFTQVQINQLSEILAQRFSARRSFQPLQLALLLEPASRAGDAQRATQYVFQLLRQVPLSAGRANLGTN